jgi:Ca2+-binding EF-hand superfamily protein
MPQYTNEEQQSITKEMSDKIYNDEFSIVEEELKKDANWIEASKDVYNELEGVEWSGSDEDIATKGLEMMSRFNFNLTLGTINYTARMQDADDKTKLSFFYLIDMYDKKDISKNGVLRAFKEIGLDPASYIGIASLGVGFAGKQAAATTAKTGLKEMLKRGAIKFLQSPVAVGAVEGAIYTGSDDIARQDAAIGAGIQDDFDKTQAAVATGVGAALGAGLVKGAELGGKALKNVTLEGAGELSKTAKILSESKDKETK